jgi:hypothetical protein
VPFDGSNTVEANLHALCCRHHHAEHDYGWHVEVGDDRITRWTSPAGRTYAKPPDPWLESPLLNRQPESPPDNTDGDPPQPEDPDPPF